MNIFVVYYNTYTYGNPMQAVFISLDEVEALRFVNTHNECTMVTHKLNTPLHDVAFLFRGKHGQE